MTMDDARRMIQAAYSSADIWNYFDRKYRTGDQWLTGEGVEMVGLTIENEYPLYSKYLKPAPGYNDGNFTVNDILDAYLNKTLTGREKPKAKSIDLSVGAGRTDGTFYTPKATRETIETLEVAKRRVTESNRTEVNNARAKILMFAHNNGAAETLGITRSDLNKLLRTWSKYSSKARDISIRINAGAAIENRWTGIENSSFLQAATVTTEDISGLVKAVEGDSTGKQRRYIARTMLALDTHIDYKELTFVFRNGILGTSSYTMGLYADASRTITVKPNLPNTVAHEIGHYIDHQWGREVGLPYEMTLNTGSPNMLAGMNENTRQFVENFNVFIDGITDRSDVSSEYMQRKSETFARFIDRFVNWTQELATGRMGYGETNTYNDRFQTSDFLAFAKLLQEKSAIGAVKNKTEWNGASVNYAVNPSFYNEFDAWDKTSTRGYFVLGTPSQALLDVGIPNDRIVMDKTKIRSVMLEHNLSLKTIRQLPELINDPVLILKSKTQDNSYVLYGELYNEKGTPVMASLRIKLQKTGAGVEDFNVVTSAYARNDTQSILKSSTMLYPSKGEQMERATSWAQSLRLQLPPTARESGPNNRVPQPAPKINPQNNPRSSLADKTPLADLIAQYGAFKPGEMPARNVSLPQQTTDDTRVTRFARTASEAAILTDDMADAIGRDVVDHRFDYTPVPNTEALQQAATDIARYKEEGAIKRWEAAIFGDRIPGKNEIALGETLIERATERGDVDAVRRLVAEVSFAGTRAGQAVQAMSMLKRMTGAGQLVYVDHMVSILQEEMNKRYKKKPPKIMIPEGLQNELAGALTPQETEDVMNKIFTEVAAQVPSTFADKWNAWRYLAMLGNPRTHIRNYIGNGVFMPAVALKRKIAAGILSHKLPEVTPALAEYITVDGVKICPILAPFFAQCLLSSP
jgi:hypothetical protein